MNEGWSEPNPAPEAHKLLVAVTGAILSSKDIGRVVRHHPLHKMEIVVRVSNGRVVHAEVHLIAKE